MNCTWCEQVKKEKLVVDEKLFPVLKEILVLSKKEGNPIAVEVSMDTDLLLCSDYSIPEQTSSKDEVEIKDTTKNSLILVHTSALPKCLSEEKYSYICSFSDTGLQINKRITLPCASIAKVPLTFEEDLFDNEVIAQQLEQEKQWKEEIKEKVKTREFKVINTVLPASKVEIFSKKGCFNKVKSFFSKKGKKKFSEELKKECLLFRNICTDSCKDTKCQGLKLVKTKFAPCEQRPFFLANCTSGGCVFLHNSLNLVKTNTNIDCNNFAQFKLSLLDSITKRR